MDSSELFIQADSYVDYDSLFDSTCDLEPTIPLDTYHKSAPDHPNSQSRCCGSPTESMGSPLGGGIPEAEDVTLSISTTFYPSAALLPGPTDVILVSSDRVFFYAHSPQLLSKSCNTFDGLLHIEDSSGTANLVNSIISISEPASVLNIVLHCAYDMSCAFYRPTLDDLSAAVDAMKRCGLVPANHILSSTPLFGLILDQAPLQPIKAYALAAYHNLDCLAVSVSPHLLSYPLDSLSRELAVKIGPIYLKRLFFLHLGRVEALRHLLYPLPPLHPSLDSCNFADQKKLTRAWVLASASLAWSARPDTAGSEIKAVLCPLVDCLQCDVCKASLSEHIRQVVAQWSIIKVCVVPHVDVVCDQSEFEVSDAGNVEF